MSYGPTMLAAPPPEPKKSNKLKWGCGGCLVAVVVVVLIIVVAAVASGGKSSSNSGTGSGGSSPARQTVTYVLTGSPADVTYGPSGSDFSGHAPMTVTKKLGNPSFYSITAQLKGSGTVKCELEVDGKVISHATASGGYNIAMCEIMKNPLSDKWEDTNTG